MTFLKQKAVWIGVAATLAVLIVFGLAMMGSVVGAKPRALPIALVQADRSADLPSGAKLAVGEQIEKMLVENAEMPVKWHLVDTEEEAMKGLDWQDYYGVLVLPANLSEGVASLASPTSQPASIKLVYNEGMNAQAVAAAKTILQQVAKNAGTGLTAQLLGQMEQQAQQMPVAAAKAMLTPFRAEEVVMHPVGANNANGNAPNLLIQIVWMGSLVLSVCLFLAGRAAGTKVSAAGRSRFGIVATQAAAGVALAGLASGFTLWMASSWYGMHFADFGLTWLYLWLAASAFFLLQTALLRWIGFPAMALLVLLLFFSMPLLGMAPEFMPQATRDWLYSWTPFRYAAAGLRSVLYYGGEGGDLARNYGVLWGIVTGGLALVLASGFRQSPAPDRASSTQPADSRA
ncbi:ABC transporter permease [Cohnella sp. REN36]|uniref:YhgE/Pip domain-containing protein n=1 Tax=Cohnella sp. REN36 TaxID=2887347 RepID=UPI001D13D16D|nr:ABC transporter permease [Cohnella sp. REN36]MCC3376104.1 SNG1 family protein [Cohnella sp. REN36]